jgi:hypothetical protein
MSLSFSPTEFDHPILAHAHSPKGCSKNVDLRQPTRIAPMIRLPCVVIIEEASAMCTVQPKPVTSYSALEQGVAWLLVVSLWGCAAVPAPPRAGEPLRSTSTDTAVVGRLILVRSGTDQTPYRSTADHALCFVPDNVDYDQARKGVRSATIEPDGTFKALLPPGDYKLYSQHRLSPTEWLAVLPLVKLSVSSRSADEVEYAGALRLEVEQAMQTRAPKKGTPEVREVPIAVADESQEQSRGLAAKFVPALLQLQADVALAQPQQERHACSARELFPQQAKKADADVAKGVLAGLLLIPLLAIVVVVGVLTGGGSFHFNMK